MGKGNLGKYFSALISAFYLLIHEATLRSRHRKQLLKSLSKDKILYNPVGFHPNSTPFCLNGREQKQWQRRKEFQLFETHPCFCISYRGGENIPQRSEAEEFEMEAWDNEWMCSFIQGPEKGCVPAPHSPGPSHCHTASLLSSWLTNLTYLPRAQPQHAKASLWGAGGREAGKGGINAPTPSMTPRHPCLHPSRACGLTGAPVHLESYRALCTSSTAPHPPFTL